jgi:hypothetical protein
MVIFSRVAKSLSSYSRYTSGTLILRPSLQLYIIQTQVNATEYYYASKKIIALQQQRETVKPHIPPRLSLPKSDSAYEGLSKTNEDSTGLAHHTFHRQPKSS